jgi:tetratricopeptide (TPR) repeat protein
MTAETLRLAIWHHQQGRLREAEQHYRIALKTNENDFDGLHNLGLLQAQQGRFEEAVELIRAATRVNPRSVQAHNNLGNALAILNRHEEAAASYREAITLKPDHVEAHNNLGIVLAALGRSEEAIEMYRKALALNPHFAKAYNNLGNVLGALGRHEEAIANYEKALRAAPNDAEVHNNLGVSLAALNRRAEAFAQYAKATALAPNYAEAHNNMGALLETLGRLDEAIGCCQRAITLRPVFPEAHNNLGNALKGLDRHEEALASYRQAIALKADYADAYGNLGDALRELGCGEDARTAYQTALRLAPDQPRFYRRLVNTRRITADDPQLAAMRDLLHKSLPKDEQIELHFALAKALADFGRDEEAFRHLLAGNALKRQSVVYDETAVLGSFKRIQAVFTPELMQSRQGSGNPSHAPVFVIGMIRSGTTLVEQILASHPKVHGAGERTDFAELATGNLTAGGALTAFPESFAAITGEPLADLGAQYLHRVRALAPGAERVIDKMPANFRFAGAISLTLPNARIVHVRRDPLDTCLSCFSILFAGDQPFAYDLGELGRFYSAYEALMEHWRHVLPDGAMMEVQYEELIADTERHARRIVAHCGLEWDGNCLAFHRNPRPVRTASALQVRQPIYRSSVGRWVPYRDMLQPLLAELNVDPGKP